MAQVSQFVISEFTNPSGEIVFRVTGWLDGRRIRKNFPTRADAVTERQTLEIQHIQSATGVRTAATRLTDEQLHESAFRHLAAAPKSLSFYLYYVLPQKSGAQNTRVPIVNPSAGLDRIPCLASQATIRARHFGYQLRCQSGQTPKITTVREPRCALKVHRGG